MGSTAGLTPSFKGLKEGEREYKHPLRFQRPVLNHPERHPSPSPRWKPLPFSSLLSSVLYLSLHLSATDFVHCHHCSLLLVVLRRAREAASRGGERREQEEEEEMGRGKIEIKRIENATNRQVTFSKRRNGIIKKAREISVLCDAQVSIVIFSSSGRMSEYCSPSTTLSKMLEKYQQNSGKKLWEVKHENLSAEIHRIKKENDNMQLELRHLKGEDLNSLSPKELIPIEDALQNGLTIVRDKQMEFLKKLKKNERLLEEENKHLTYLLHHQELAMNGNVREMELGYPPKDRDFASQIPIAFRVQPIQPNLQENK